MIIIRQRADMTLIKQGFSGCCKPSYGCIAQVSFLHIAVLIDRIIETSE